MYTRRLLMLGLIAPLLALGLAVVPARPARADNDWAWALGGLLLGSLLFNDDAHHYAYYEPPAAQAYYYPHSRVYVWPERSHAKYYPYGYRYWKYAGANWQGRPVYAPVQQAPKLRGPRRWVKIDADHQHPVFRVHGRHR
jgi:hypothetical protein